MSCWRFSLIPSFSFPGLENRPGRLRRPKLPRRRRRDARLPDREQEPRRQQRGLEAPGAPDDDQSQAARDPEDGLLADAEAHAAHPGASREGDRPAHAGDPGNAGLSPKKTSSVPADK